MSGDQDNGNLDKLKKGYQPAKPADDQSEGTKPDGGYQPTSEGDNPSDSPPPGDE